MPIAEDPDFPPPTDRASEQQGEQQNDPFADLVLDEEFVKGAAIQEPSGRARMLGAKWKRQPPPANEPWRPPTEVRRKRFARRPAAVDPWGNPKRRKERNWQTPVFVLLTAAVVLAGLNMDQLRGWYSTNFGGGDSSAGSPAALPANPKPAAGSQAPETAAPTAAPPTTDPSLPTVDHPWAGSPADGWPAGADAIVAPPAQAVGVFGQDEVAKQLQDAKAFLAATNLDPRAIAGATPQAALDLLDPHDSDRLAQRLAHPTDKENPLADITRIDPRDALLIGDVIKVQGRMSFESDGAKGVLVHADYTFVYPLRPGPEAGRRRAGASPTGAAPGAVSWTVRQAGVSGSTVSTRTIVRRLVTFRFADPKHFQVAPGKLVIAESQTDPANTSCDISDGFYHPEFPQADLNGPASGDPSGPASDPYDRSKVPGQDDSGCGTASRI